MASTTPNQPPITSTTTNYSSDTNDDGQAWGGRKAANTNINASATAGALSTLPNPPTSDNLAQPAGNLLKGATDKKGNLKDAGLMIGIKLDLEAEVHLTARVRGDVVIGLY